MVGQDIHGGAAIHGPKEPFLALVWTDFERLVRAAIVLNFANFSTCMFVHVSGCMYDFYLLIFEPMTKC